MRILNRGRQLRLALFETIPKPKRISSSYTPAPSKGSLGPAGPSARTRSAAPPAESPDIEFNPQLSERTARSGGRVVEDSVRAPKPARTDLGVGTLTVRCPTGADVWVDGAHLGGCPIRMPLAAGRHEVTVRRGTRSLGTEEIVLERGKTFSLRLPE